jgi:ActR/RegA family two-component response regulator
MEKALNRILLVDDDHRVVWSLGRYLIRAGFALSTCCSSRDAKYLLEQSDISTVVMEIQLPESNGLDLLDWISQERPGVKVIVVTTFGSDSVEQLCLKKGAAVYLHKPLDPTFLVEFLRRQPADNQRIAGTVSDIDLLDYLQLLALNRKSSVIDLSCGAERGRIFVDQGLVVHAECGTQQGEAAFFHCFQAQHATFAAYSWREPTTRTMRTSGEYLLMEVVRLSDEASAGLGDSQSLDTIDTNADDLSFGDPLALGEMLS